MEIHLGHEKNPKHLKALESQSLQNTRQSSKLGDRFKQDKLGPPSVDLVKDMNNVQQCKTEWPDHMQHGHNKGDEVVRYMSNLPGYLERGVKQEKAFNVGVLEWGRLEKWQHTQRQLFRESSTYSPSSSNTSSNSSTSKSSKGRTCTPGRLRTYHATAESNRRGSLSKVSSTHGAKSSVKDVFTASDDIVAIRSDYVKVQQSILKTHQCFNKYTERAPEESKPNHHHHHHHRESVSNKSRPPQEHENRFLASDLKGKLKVQNGDLLVEKLKGSNNHQQTVVLLRPKDVKEIKQPVVAEPYNSTKIHGPDFLGAKMKVPFGHSPIELPSSARVKDIKFPFETKRAIVYPRGSSVSPVRGRTPEGMSNKEFNDPTMAATVKVARELALVHPRGSSVGHIRFKTPEDNSNKELGDSALIIRKEELVHPYVSSVSPIRSKTPLDKSNNSIAEPVVVRNPKHGFEVDNKERNVSPFRRFSFSMGRIVKSSSSDDLSGLAQTCSENSNASRKTSVSPLRRLLDPFLKAKTGSSDHSPGSAPGQSLSRDRNGNVSNRIGESNALNSVKVKLDLSNCKEIDTDHQNDMNKHGSTTLLALLQIALKNGLPLFTFAVENSSDILAATMTRLSSGKKDGNNWIFTFFTVHEMKKKSGSWLNYANKEKKQGYIPNVVGQMKVSDVQFADNFRIREFVLLGVNLRHADEKSSDLQVNDELAAIVLQLPTTTQEGNHRKSFTQKLSTMVDSTDSYQKSENLLGLTAILPGGQHGLPCNGRPSPLLERWRFGGSCDCGGWDLGCRLRVLTNDTYITKQSNSDTSKKLHLYSQDHALERKPVVSLSPFKDGIYSVEFDSSLKLLQAFSMCIAILNGLKPLEFLEMGSFFHKKTLSEELNNTRPNTEGFKNPHIIDEEVIPACFVSCPPGTPADRV